MENNKIKNIRDAYSERQKKIILSECNTGILATDFYLKYKDELDVIELMQVYARIKSIETQNKIQEMLFSESDILDSYYLRKAGNWVSCDIYLPLIKENEIEYLKENEYIVEKEKNERMKF